MELQNWLYFFIMTGEVYTFGIKMISTLGNLTYKNKKKMANKILNVTNHLNKGFINTAGNSGSSNYLSWLTGYVG